MTSRALARAGVVEQNDLGYMVVLEVAPRAQPNDVVDVGGGDDATESLLIEEREGSNPAKSAVSPLLSRQGGAEASGDRDGGCLVELWHVFLDQKRLLGSISHDLTLGGESEARVSENPTTLLLICELDRPVCDAACEVCP